MAAWSQSTASPTQLSFPHPLSFLSRAVISRQSRSAFPVACLCPFSDAQIALLGSHPKTNHKHKCHRGLVQLGVYLLAPRASCSPAVLHRHCGALRSNTPFKVRRFLHVQNDSSVPVKAEHSQHHLWTPLMSLTSRYDPREAQRGQSVCRLSSSLASYPHSPQYHVVNGDSASSTDQLMLFALQVGQI